MAIMFALFPSPSRYSKKTFIFSWFITFGGFIVVSNKLIVTIKIIYQRFAALNIALE